VNDCTQIEHRRAAQWREQVIGHAGKICPMKLECFTNRCSTTWSVWTLWLNLKMANCSYFFFIKERQNWCLYNRIPDHSTSFRLRTLTALNIPPPRFYASAFAFASFNARQCYFNGGVSANRDVSSRATTSIISTRTADKPRRGQICIYNRETALSFHTSENCMPSVLTVISLEWKEIPVHKKKV
jgi:hypothetical protein